MTQGKLFTHSLDGQRQMLDELAALSARSERPSVSGLANTLGIGMHTARRCLLWLQAEGFVKFSNVHRYRADIELIRNPGDDELAAAIAKAGAQ